MYRCVKKRKRKKLPIIIAAVLLFCIAVFIYSRTVVIPVIKTLTENKIKAMAVTTVNKSVMSVLDETPAYVDMVSISYDNENNINGIRLKSAVANTVMQKATLATQNDLSALGQVGVSLPVGSLTGIMFLSGKGYDVNIKVMPVGTVTAKFCSEFTEAGINQTNHRIFLRINAKVSIILPGANNVVETVTDVLLLESVIVGKIPQTYLHATDTQDMMDLIP